MEILPTFLPRFFYNFILVLSLILYAYKGIPASLLNFNVLLVFYVFVPAIFRL